MPGTSSVAVLCGGFGAARFVPAVAGVSPELCCIVNTADDLHHLGLHISPDVDSVCYGLAGRFDEERGWGLIDDTFRGVDALDRYGQGWFRIGDQDLRFSLLRTGLLRSGLTLSDATRRLTEDLGIDAEVLPMSDDPVRTVVHTDAGALGFQDYLVRHRAEPRVRGIEYCGITAAAPAPGVLDALRTADVVLIAPSSPVASITPILRLPGVLDTLGARRGPTIAVTPVVSAQAPGSAPERGRAIVRSTLMQWVGIPHRAAEVARLYRPFLDGFVIDERDGAQRTEIEALGLRVLVADTLAKPGTRSELADAVLGFAASYAPTPIG